MHMFALACLLLPNSLPAAASQREAILVTRAYLAASLYSVQLLSTNFLVLKCKSKVFTAPGRLAWERLAVHCHYRRRQHWLPHPHLPVQSL